MLVAFCLLMVVRGGFAHASGDAVGRAEATLLLEQAQAAVAQAAQQGALWTTAQEALERARSMHAEGEFAQSARAAHSAIEQARLGIAQRAYPPLRY